MRLTFLVCGIELAELCCVTNPHSQLCMQTQGVDPMLDWSEVINDGLKFCLARLDICLYVLNHLQCCKFSRYSLTFETHRTMQIWVASA